VRVRKEILAGWTLIALIVMSVYSFCSMSMQVIDEKNKNMTYEEWVKPRLLQ